MLKPMLAGKVDDPSKLTFPLLATPKLDGIRLANTIKDESDGKTAVIIITAITHSLAEDLKSSRADDSFGKPIPWRKLKKRILQLIPELTS